ncbi:hypothetical protein [Paenibacillus glycanilyticus]|uniref:Mannosyl-glycoprotein endo-beta-N-acetylglucosamidase-like domain-containing protein n=1 Tax=Paenibacillus glycanilyticus TaxID=126569 RepID=A0ABQ6GCW5_9BACL|nr:hypothetical protein [Paenibacillus glycanilyticus]GLX68093.1 hypothetical protein MU1_24380 [Paenibacillus glycanilyticus]
MPTDDAFVLTPTDVRNIRQYVQHKYAALPQDKKAEIVADAVTRIIRKQLPSFDGELKREVTAKLIRTAVLEKQMPVRADDIFEACLELDLGNPQVALPLHRWVEEQTGASLAWEMFHLQMDKLAKNRQETTDAAAWEELKLWLQTEQLIDEKAKSEPTLAEVIPMPVEQRIELAPKVMRWKQTPVYLALSLSLVSASLLYGWSLLQPSPNKLQPPVALQSYDQMKPSANGLPAELRFVTVDKVQLVNYLESKDSILADQPYLDAIIAAAKTYDIHPLLLFAITGQEQAFVPKSNKQAEKIANNPFNVFHSWKEYNTTILDSARIASKTIVRMSKGRPEGVDPITWINKDYAEDKNWANGVRKIFAALKRQTEVQS